MSEIVADIISAEKVLDAKSNITGVHIIVALSKLLTSNETYIQEYQTVLPPEAVNDVQGYANKWINSGTAQDFNAAAKMADQTEIAKTVPKQAIDVTGIKITVDPTIAAAVVADATLDTATPDPIK